MRRRTLRAVGLFSSLALARALAAEAALSNPPHKDVNFLAEHVPEAAQDARAFAIPWPGENRAVGEWHLFAGAGASAAEANFARVRGGMFTLGASRALSVRSGILLFGFYDGFTVSGGSGTDVLRASFGPTVPLDLPEPARFSRPRGTVTHTGLGFAWTRAFGAAAEGGQSPWLFEAGVMADRLEVKGYRFDYELLGGADAGARGVLDHSSSATYATPFVGLQRTVALGGSSWVLRPRVMLGVPLPPGDFDARLTGPGFDVSTNGAGGRPGRIGDGFVAFGAGLLERRSGLEIDLGSALVFPLFERFTHDGLDRALMLNLTWHP